VRVTASNHLLHRVLRGQDDEGGSGCDGEKEREVADENGNAAVRVGRLQNVGILESELSATLGVAHPRDVPPNANNDVENDGADSA